jgi:hypothetical protein
LKKKTKGKKSRDTVGFLNYYRGFLFRENISLKEQLDAAESSLEKERGLRELLDQQLTKERSERELQLTNQRTEQIPGQLLAALHTWQHELPIPVR